MRNETGLISIHSLTSAEKFIVLALDTHGIGHATVFNVFCYPRAHKQVRHQQSQWQMKYSDESPFQNYPKIRDTPDGPLVQITPEIRDTLGGPPV